MRATIIRINADEIMDWDSFHTVFKRDLGFPDFYGENMNAWIDCMTDIDDPGAGMTTFTINDDELAVLEVRGIRSFRERCPEQYAALVECSAFVNYRRIDVGQRAILSLTLID